MSLHKLHHGTNQTERQDQHDRNGETSQPDTANKENLLSDFSAHLAVHAERMKLLKRAEEGLEKLSADPFIVNTSEHGNRKDKLSATQTIEIKQDKVANEQKKSKLPISAARQRRRERKDGGKSKIQIKNYKPGYTWNRGGRVKELRIRCLARKFSQIWKKQTFGRVMPSTARYHHQKHLMKLAFDEWYDMWWHVRKEWRLMVRAECHFRYLAWTKHFEAWKEFIVFKKEEKGKEIIAVKHDTNQTLKKALNLWKGSTLSQKLKNKKNIEATQFYENSLVKKNWHTWKERFDMKQHRKNIDVIALQFWAYRLQVQHWLIWCDAYKKRQVLHNKAKLAVRHNKFYTMQRALTAWMAFWTMKKEKQKEKEYAQSLYHRSVLVKCMRVWVNHYNRRMVIQNHQTHIEELADRFTKRRYLQRWLQYVELQHEKEEKDELAVTHYVRKLKVIGLSAFRLNLVQKRMKEMRMEMAANFYITMLTKRHWNRWMAKCEHNEELAIHSLTVKATIHYRMVVCKKMIDAWLDYVEWRKHKQAQYDKADAYYYVRAMPVLFISQSRCNRISRFDSVFIFQAQYDKADAYYYVRAMPVLFVSQSRCNRISRFDSVFIFQAQYDKANAYYYVRANPVLYVSQPGCNSISRFDSLFIFQAQYDKADAYYYVRAMPVLFVSQSRCNRISRFDSVFIFQAQYDKADAYYYVRAMPVLLVSQSRCNRISRFDSVFIFQAQYDKADAYYYVRAMPVFLHHIKAHVELQKRNRQYGEVAVQFRRENLSARFFYMWFNNFEQSREDRMNERMAILHYDSCIFKRHFCNWKNRYQQALEESKKEEQAIKHFNKVLCKKHLKALKQYIDDLNLGEINDAKATKHNYLHHISVLFKTWKQYVLYKRQQRVKKSKADMFYKRHVYQKVMKRLKNNLIQRRQFKQIAEEQSSKKCQQLLRWTLHRWRDNCEEQQEDRQTENMAICHYHRCLLTKVTTAWHRYAVIHAYKKSEMRQWVENTQKTLNHNKLQRYFSFWRTTRDESILKKLKTEQAAQHYNRVLLQNLISQWKEFVQDSIKKKLLIKQSVWFNEVRLKTWSIATWKQEHAKTQETAQKSALAMWHWSLNLQKQALIAWYMYAQERKRKKNRINEALERRRNRLVRNGITQWLSVANDLSGLRAKFAAQQHATNAFSLHQLVQKCALHWRHWTARRKSQRLPASNFVTFHQVKPKVDFMLRPEPSVPEVLKQPAKQVLPAPVLLAPPVVSQGAHQERLVPMVSESPVRSRGLVPEGLPGKHVEFKVDRNLPSRRKPRHPSFLAESLKRAGLFSVDQQNSECEKIAENKIVEKENFENTSIPAEMLFNNFEVHKESSSEMLKLNDKNKESATLSMLKTEPTSTTIQSSSTGQTSGLIGSDPTLQIRGFIDKNSSTEKNQSDIENVTQRSEKTLSSINSDVNVMEKNFTAPKQGYRMFETKLLTPADFLATKMTSTLTKDIAGNLPHVGLSPRDRIDGISSINSTLKTKDSVDLLSSADNSGKFKESMGFVKSTDDTGTKSADSLLPIDIDSPRLEKKGTVLANQITDIRNRLKGFNEKKRRLRKLQKQHIHLSDWLEQEVKKGEEIETEDIRKEIIEIEAEMRKLNQEIDIEKPMCAKLVSEVQILVKLLQGSETN
ncbi:protein SFI1 [Mytilus galloprovincialis]|uniref:Protein SFI1 n=2 Tax=Mytilus galloprovincialis TaxID=29158 RepID=A0A8B6CK24_MYTGA|nr:protein SFI1 [Mytilus galloprovincialis]